MDKETRNKLEFALKILENKDDYSYGVISSDVSNAIDILINFAKRELDKWVTGLMLKTSKDMK